MNDVLRPGQSLDELLDGIEFDGDRAQFAAPSDWGQGRAPYGGLVGAAAARALESAAPDRPLRSMMVSFVGPVAPGIAEMEIETLRAGRSATHASVRIAQEGTVRAAVLGCLGQDRESSLIHQGSTAPDMTPVEDVPSAPYIEGIMPAFVQHVHMRFAVGDPPYSGRRSEAMGGFCRFRVPTRRVDASLIAGLADIWPAPVIPWLKAPAPASSMTWNLEIVHLDPSLPTDAWWTYRAVTEATEHGYVHFRAELWDAKGRLAAVSRQLAAVFA